MVRTVAQAKEELRLIIKEFFKDYVVIFDKQSRTAKPQIPLVTISPGNARRHRSNNEIYNFEETEGYILYRLPIILDLFTNGQPVYDGDTLIEVGRSNTAVDEMLSLLNFINSQYVTLRCYNLDISIIAENDVQDLTGIVNDTTYEFRSRMTINLYFTQKTVGEYGKVVTD